MTAAQSKTLIAGQLDTLARRADNSRLLLAIILGHVGRQQREIAALRAFLSEGPDSPARAFGLEDGGSARLHGMARWNGTAPGD